MNRMTAQTMFEKIWRAHEVVPETADTPAVIYVDRHLTHEVTSPQAFAQLAARGIGVRRPELTLATLDHAVPTDTGELFGGVPIRLQAAARQIGELERNARKYGFELLGLTDARRGIVHVVGPELGITQPGMTIVCGDSHTSTHGAFGALAFGIGTTEVAHVLATQCLLQRKPGTFAITVDGRLAAGVGAKDLALAIIGRIGVAGGARQAIEYRGATIRALTMDERMTLCNMSIEAGARAGMIAPDQATFDYLRGRPRAPAGDDWEGAVERWRAGAGDAGAAFDRELEFDATAVEPMISYGTNPGMAMPVTGTIPHGDGSERQALRYMGLQPGETLRGRAVQVVFIGSCTNARLSDLRAAAAVLRGRRIAPRLRMLVVPGSQQVKRAAEAEGLHRVFLDAGAEWRESGCSMCIAMNDDRVDAGRYAVSTSNRNFEGRQGPGARTFLASPLTAAAAAVRGHICDPRELMQ
jgi:3-isopropylmalate/(R)-2-methylmalate dehydratase large subunit